MTDKMTDSTEDGEKRPTFLNFAYGSNMLTERLQARVPSARAVTVGMLAGYGLRWHKMSNTGSGKCDVVNAPGEQVIGVIYEILQSEKGRLDKAEGLGDGYDEMHVIVETADGPIEAQTYFATNIDDAAVPFTWYKALVLAGARQHKFPEWYIKAIGQVAAKDDTNLKRATENFQLAASQEAVCPPEEER